MISSVNHITLSVKNLDEGFNFYTEILGLKPLAKCKGKSAYLLAGNDWIVLVKAKDSKERVATSYAHLAFSVSEKEFAAMAEKIRSSGAEIWQDNSSPGESLYFLDPSGNRLEIHVGSWQSRLDWLKDHPTPEVEIYI